MLSIYLQFLKPCSLRKHPPRGWPRRRKSLRLFLSKYSLLASSIPPLYQQLFSCVYTFTFSSHLTDGLPLLLGPSISFTYTFFTNFNLYFYANNFIWGHEVFFVIYYTVAIRVQIKFFTLNKLYSR